MLFQVGDSPNPGLTELIARFSEVSLSSKKIRLSKISKPEGHAPWDYDVKVREAGAKILDAPKINLNSLLHQADLSSFYRLPLISYLMDIIISINHGDNQNLEQIRGRSHNSHLQPDCPVDSGVNISHLSFSFGHLLQIYLAWQIWTLTGEKTADDQWGAVGGFQAAWGQWGP